jgi:hypothetical protein
MSQTCMEFLQLKMCEPQNKVYEMNAIREKSWQQTSTIISIPSLVQWKWTSLDTNKKVCGQENIFKLSDIRNLPY